MKDYEINGRFKNKKLKGLSNIHSQNKPWAKDRGVVIHDRNEGKYKCLGGVEWMSYLRGTALIN